MNLRDSLNQYYFDMTVSDLRRLGRTGGGGAFLQQHDVP